MGAGVRCRRACGTGGCTGTGADPHARASATAGAGASARPAAAWAGHGRRARRLHPRHPHIEFNAIDLAWDAAYRFRSLPPAFHADWVRIAEDEARHFTLLRGRLQALGHDYGDFDAHNGLWEMAEKTAHDGLARMALVPRVLEARGLDVTPGMIVKLRALGDDATADILAVILEEEVAHVAAGSHWFRWYCARAGIAPEPRFRELLAEYARAVLHGPFNIDARAAAGFSEDELAALQAAASDPQVCP